jgi:delta 1-pyrroline-5-carboxylate dehydrogenase
MLGQSKTAYQAEIDAACELIDFWRFNVAWAEEIYRQQPRSAAGAWNRVEHRPLEGFVFAVTPFNFTSIAGNLPTAPALMGNTVVWKPASTSVVSAHVIMELLEAAGLPPGVINMVPGPGAAVGDSVLASPHLAGIHFTGSTGVFQGMWETVGRNVRAYRAYPRVVGETGGKDFVFAHPSAEVDALAAALVRGAFEYQGQKCSAVSRAYIPSSLWPRVQARLLAQVAEIRMGDVLARLGGDEFGVIFEHCPMDKARHLAEMLLAAIKDFRFAWQSRRFEIGASIGLVPVTADSGGLTEILSAADSACYVAKDHGRNRIHVYQPDDLALSQRHGEMQWVHRLRQGLDNNSFDLHCQSLFSRMRALPWCGLFRLSVRRFPQDYG